MNFSARTAYNSLNVIISLAVSNPRAACDPFEGFVRPSLGFRCSISIPDTDNLSLFG